MFYMNFFLSLSKNMESVCLSDGRVCFMMDFELSTCDRITQDGCWYQIWADFCVLIRALHNDNKMKPSQALSWMSSWYFAHQMSLNLLTLQKSCYNTNKLWTSRVAEVITLNKCAENKQFVQKIVFNSGASLQSTSSSAFWEHRRLSASRIRPLFQICIICCEILW